MRSTLIRFKKSEQNNNRGTMKKKVLISTSSFAEYDRKPISLLEGSGLEVKLNPFGRKLTENEAKDLYMGVDFIIAGIEPITRNVLESSKSIKVISRCGTGLDNIDLDASKELGVEVFNTPYGPTLAVAELTMGLILNILRKINQTDKVLRKGIWQKNMGSLLQGKNVGIIGFGKIGQKVAELLISFDANVGYYDVNVIEHSLDCKPFDMISLLSWANIISIHSSLLSKEAILGENEFRTIKKGSYIINTSRGGMVDEEVLYSALKDGHIAGACLDVFDKEPYKGKLAELDNVILTPHIGSYAREARIKMEINAVQNLLSYINRK